MVQVGARRIQSPLSHHAAPWLSAVAAAIGVSVVSITTGQSGPVQWETHMLSNCFKCGTCMSPSGACGGVLPGKRCSYCEYQNTVSECELDWTLTSCWQSDGASGDPVAGCGLLVFGICQNSATPFCGTPVSSSRLCERPICTDQSPSGP